MPMLLRDGRFYSPVESEHMILRDGKSVDAKQAYVYDGLLCGEIRVFGSDNIEPSQDFVSGERVLKIDDTSKKFVGTNNFQGDGAEDTPKGEAHQNQNEYYYNCPNLPKSTEEMQCQPAGIIVSEGSYTAKSKQNPKIVKSTTNLVTVSLKRFQTDYKVVWILTAVSGVILLSLALGFYYPQHRLLHPNQIGLENGYETTLDRASKIPAWHILPNKTSNNCYFSDASPNLMLHVRENGYLDSHHRIRIFRTLSQLGFHIFAPIYSLSRPEMLEAWLYMHKNIHHSAAYIWMEKLPTETVKRITMEMCKLDHPPTGVIIETKRDGGLAPKRSLEVWSNECQNDNIKTKFNVLKCPIVSDMDSFKTMEEVKSCVNFISTDTNFKAR